MNVVSVSRFGGSLELAGESGRYPRCVTLGCDDCPPSSSAGGGPSHHRKEGRIILKRLIATLAGLALVLVLAGPQTAFARMHFTTTNERLDALTQAARSSLSLTDPAAIQTQINEITTQAQAA